MRCVTPMGQIPKERGQFAQATPLLQKKAASPKLNSPSCVKPRAGIAQRLMIRIITLKKCKS